MSDYSAAGAAADGEVVAGDTLDDDIGVAVEFEDEDEDEGEQEVDEVLVSRKAWPGGVGASPAGNMRQLWIVFLFKKELGCLLRHLTVEE